MTLTLAFLIGILITTFLALFSKPSSSITLGCGILGFSGDMDFDPLKVKLLFLYNEQRGGDSCGIYTETGKRGGGYDYYINKKVGKASTLLANKELTPTNFLIGHTRKMTVGLISEDNAHPYKYKNLVGAHNGGITNYIMMCNSRNIPGTDYWVDSQGLYRSMEHDKGYEKALEEYDGGAALLFTIFDNLEDSYKESHKLYAYHDKEKPLYHGRVKINGKIGTYISSIRESLECIGCSKIREFPVETLHIFQNGKLIETKKIKRNPLKHKPAEPTPLVPTVPYARNRHSSTYAYNGYKVKRHSNDIIERRGMGYYSEVDRYADIHTDLYVGNEVEPSILGLKQVNSFVIHVKKGRVAFSNLHAKTISLQVLALMSNAPDKFKVGQYFQDIPMEYFEPVAEKEKEEQTKEECSSCDTPTSAVNTADIEITPGCIKSQDIVEKELSCSDFDDVRDQYWATLLEIRQRLINLEEKGYWATQEEAFELVEYIENEIFTMFSLNV